MDQRLSRILGGDTKQYPHALEEKYPRVFSKIMALWDSPEIDDYFMELIVDKRGGRAGFPADVAAEIVHLSLVHAAHHSARQQNDVWDVASSSFIDFASTATPEEINAWKEPPAQVRRELEAMGVRCTQAGFLQAAELGNRAAVGLFLDAGVHPEIRNEQGWTPLMLAAFNGHEESVALLLKHHADVFVGDSGGNTALHWAAFAGHVGCAQKLLEQHADVNARNSQSYTPLLQAVSRRHLSVVMLLINHGANLNMVNREGNTALHKAAAAGYAEIIRPLLEQGADLSIKNLQGETAVKLAIKNQHDKVVQKLLAVQEQRM